MTKLESVGDLMTKHVVTVGKTDSVKKAAKIMAGDNIGSIVVVEKGDIVGILTERDLSRKIVAGGMDASRVKVSEAMSSPVTTVTPETSILDAGGLLDRNNFKKLPVVSDGKLVGIVTEADLIHAMRSRIHEVEPKAERKADGRKSKYKLEPGRSYLIKEERSDKSFDILTDRVMGGTHGLVISRIPPKRLRNQYGLENTPLIWLTNTVSDERTISPHSFSELSILVGKFLREVDNCVILLDGLEYLITHNSYSQTLRLIQHLRDKVSATGSHLIISINENALNEKQIKLLEQEMDIILSELHWEEGRLDTIRERIGELEKD